MTNLQRAKELFSSGEYTLVLVCGEEVFTSNERGIAPVLKLATEGKCLNGYSAADKIVGRAAALLYARLGIKEVYAEVLSEGGRRVLEAHGIGNSCNVFTQNIINRAGDDICPMEKAVSGTQEPQEAVLLLQAAIARMKAARR